MSSAFSKSSVFVYPHLHAKSTFSKSPFTLIVFIRYVWTEAASVKKNLRFQMKTDTCGRVLSRAKRHCRRGKQRQRNVQKKCAARAIFFLLIRSIDFVAVLIAVTV